MLPEIFLGSAKENDEVIRSVRSELNGVARCLTHKNFESGKSFFENLLQISRRVDFGLFILAADDLLMKREAPPKPCPRDNTILELGIFSGALGADRTFALRPIGCQLELPSDIDGIHWTEYDTQADDISDGIIVAIDKVVKQIKRNGRRSEVHQCVEKNHDPLHAEVEFTELERPRKGKTSKRLNGQGISISKVEESFLVESSDKLEKQVIKIAGGEWWRERDGWRADQYIVDRLIKNLPQIKILE